MSVNNDLWDESNDNCWTPTAFQKSKYITSLKIVSEDSEIDAEILDIYKRCKNFPVVGLDCEWNPTRRKNEKPVVALLQIATRDGYCVLIRTCFISHLPTTLMNFLNDKSILKTGVSVFNDGEILKSKYNSCRISGRLDIRYLTRQCNIYSKKETLKELTKALLPYELEKSNVLRYCWDYHILDEETAQYAALDALAGVQIFDKLLPLYHEQISPTEPFEEVLIPKYIKKYFTNCPDMCSRVLDKKFK